MLVRSYSYVIFTADCGKCRSARLKKDRHARSATSAVASAPVCDMSKFLLQHELVLARLLQLHSAMGSFDTAKLQSGVWLACESNHRWDRNLLEPASTHRRLSICTEHV